MKKATVLFIALLFLFPVISEAQEEWVNEGPWPFLPDSVYRGSTHGIAVDPDGNVWVQNFYATGQIIRDGDTTAVTELYVFNPDGEQLPFSPVQSVEVGGTEYMFVGSNGRGLRRGPNGNILAAHGSRLFLIDYQTGAGIATVVPPDSTSLVAPGVDGQGRVFTAHVLPGNRVTMYDSNLENPETLIPEVAGFSRSFEVSEDGNTVYWGSYTTHVLTAYTRDSEFDPFPEFPDTVLVGVNPESFVWHPVTGHLWFSAGSYNDPANRFEGVVTNYRNNVWYAYDVENDAIVDSLEWNFRVPENPNERPRAIDFSPDGDIAYIGTFGDNANDAVQRLVRQPVSVRPDDRQIVEGFTLSQNYPNPFNPSTEIAFTLTESALVTLTVYDVLGREVATLVNDYLGAGAYTATFDAAQLTSGTYIYTLESQGQRLSKRMLLIK